MQAQPHDRQATEATMAQLATRDASDDLYLSLSLMHRECTSLLLYTLSQLIVILNVESESLHRSENYACISAGMLAI